MQNWLRRWIRLGQKPRARYRARRPMVENLEDRCLLAAPVIDPINILNPVNNNPLTIPANKTLILPVTATDVDGNPLTYTATSSSPSITVTPRNNPHPYWKISVA